MKALVIDNELEIRRSVVELIKAFCPEIKEVSEASSVNSGIQKIKDFAPDILFLDVELGDGTGMNLLSGFDKIDFSVIFITAHEKYALDAFRFSAIDFLLKPIDPEELMRSVQKVLNLNTNTMVQQIAMLKELISDSFKGDRKIVLRDSNSIHFVKISDIIHCESDRSYTTFKISNSKDIVVSKGLKNFEELLGPMGFIRTHQSHLVNISKIVRFDKRDGGHLIMENGSLIPVSQRKKDQITELFHGL